MVAIAVLLLPCAAHAKEATGKLVMANTTGEAVEKKTAGELDREGEEKTITVHADLLMMRAADPTDETRRSADFIDRQLAGPNSTLQTVMNTFSGIEGGALGRVHFRGDEKGPGFSIDGMPMPIQLETRSSQWIDPRFLDFVSLKAGGLDASEANPTIDLSPQIGAGQPCLDILPTVGTLGTTDILMRAAGSNKKGDFQYYIGAQHGETDLREEPPDPRSQTLNNHGGDTNLLARLNLKKEKDLLGLTMAYENSRLGVPQTPLNGAAGVRQDIPEESFLGVLSWKRIIEKNADFKLGLVYLQARQDMTNNGIYTPYVAMSPELSPELAEDNLPLNPEDFGSPYIATSRLSTSQLQPTFELNYRPTDCQNIKVGALADFINTQQFVDITDAGGGGGLPNPENLDTPPTKFLADASRQGFFGSAWFSHSFPLFKDWMTFNYGLRGDTFNDGATVSGSQLSPRLNLALAFSETQSLHLSFNRYFQPPPLEFDPSGRTVARPQRTSAYEISYEFQPARQVLGKLSLVYNDYQDRLEMGMLIPNSNIPLYTPVTFDKALYRGIEFSINTQHPLGWNGFVTATVGEAKPLSPEPDGDIESYFDDDQRVQLTGGLSHQWKKGWLVSADFLYGSGYPQNAIPEYNEAGINPFGLVGERFPRFITNLRLGWLPEDRKGKSGSGVSLVVQNLFDTRPILHFQSDYSGTRFVPEQRIMLIGSLRW